jgi:hypothetical protein
VRALAAEPTFFSLTEVPGASVPVHCWPLLAAAPPRSFHFRRDENRRNPSDKGLTMRRSCGPID